MSTEKKSELAMDLKNEHGVRIFPQPECNQLFIIFTGLRGGVFLDPESFISYSGLYDRNIVVLRDVRKDYFYNGISKRLNNLQKVIDWLKKFLHRSPWIEHVYCIGSSAGGTAALIIGHFMNAKSIFAFAIATPSERILSRGMSQFLAYRRVDALDYLKEFNGSTQYMFYYNENNKRDVLSVDRFRAIKSASFHPLAGQGHLLFVTTEQKNLLSDLFPPISYVITGE